MVLEEMTKEKIIQIAIDGPAGSGKSTVAKLVAVKLGLVYLDTGAMYRSFALYVLKNNYNYIDDELVLKLWTNFNIMFKGNELLLNGENITSQIRTSEVESFVSIVASNKLLREKMVQLQQSLGKKQSIVMEGRDIGTVVLKEAKHKFFISADVQTRAKRRYVQNLLKGIDVDFNELLREMKLRDDIDSTRAESPLMAAKSAIILDTTSMSINEVVDVVCEIVQKG